MKSASLVSRLLRNHVFLLSAGLVLTSLFIYFSMASKKPALKSSSDPGFSNYVQAYTGGLISKMAVIRVQLTPGFADSLKNPDLGEEILEFEPAISGEYRWREGHILEFFPNDPLPHSTVFQATLHLNKVKELPEAFSTFYFHFQTYKPGFAFDEPEVEAPHPLDMVFQNVRCSFKSADVERNADIEKLVEARLGNQKLSIKWEHDSIGKTHLLSIDSLRRERYEQTLVLTWEGSRLGYSGNGRKEISIAPKSAFRVEHARVVEGVEQYVSIRFSDPLDARQDLTGLVRLDTFSASQVRVGIDRNEIRVYPPHHLSGNLGLRVESGIRNATGESLKETFSETLIFSDPKPFAAFLGNGVIIPNSPTLVLPFESASLSAVDVVVLRIFESNVEQFLQINSLNGGEEILRVGRPVVRTTLRLDDNPLLDLRKTNRFALDLSKHMKAEPGAIYRVKISFKKAYSLYRCFNETTSEQTEKSETTGEAAEEPFDTESWYSDPLGEGDYEDYDWEERDDPCSPSYFNGSRFPIRNVLASDLGIIAKKGLKNDFLVAVNDLKTTQPISGVEVRILNFQRQTIGQGITGNDGMLNVPVSGKAFLLVARKGSQKGYLKLDDGNSLSTSRFDIQGEAVSKGLKGFLFGERGVWRPGDSLFLQFLLDDRASPLPKGHPIVFEMFTPQGQLYKRLVQTNPVGSFYSFTTTTGSDAPTGTWEARVKAGGAVFTKGIRIEMVQPNRLAIQLGFQDAFLTKGQKFMANLNSKWLHGAPARNLKATVEASFTKTPTQFKSFKNYVFDMPGAKSEPENEMVFEGQLDAEGNTRIEHELKAGEEASGMLMANMLTRVYESGGSYSIDRFSIPYHPFDVYFGIRTPASEGISGELPTDSSHEISIVAVQPDGQLSAQDRRVRIQVYKLNWRFWWDRSVENLGSFTEEDYYEPVQTDEIDLEGGKGNWKLRVNYPEWGRYLVKVTDVESGGHSTGQVVYLDWPSWYGRAPKDGPNEAAFLPVTASKETCKTGEEILLTFPSGQGGRALVSLENGTRVVKTFWTPTQPGQTRFRFKVTPEMAPNVFMHVCVLQPHGQLSNDLPIRMYGMLPLKVEDPATRLQPLITGPKTMRPEETSNWVVSEATGKPMTYTLAVVDDGLLNLTRFKVPDPHGHFYAREALGVKTWDLYDLVSGAFTVAPDRILAVGGDEGMNRKGGDRKANRFKPVVRFLGPFYLQAGGRKTHAIKLPPYVGSVRLMVVAAQNGAFGATEKSVPVKKPLMVLATVPRVLGLNEEVQIPVTVFAMEKSVRQVSVRLETSNPLQGMAPLNQSIAFSETGDQTILFRIKSAALPGLGKIRVVASSGKETATYALELDVRNPNPHVTESQDGQVTKGKTWSAIHNPTGTPGTRSAWLEVSSMPSLQLEKRLSYLIQYPYGCVEQTTSSVFPQLALGDLMELESGRRARIEQNVKAGILRLRGFQQSSGGFSYWPGVSLETDDWGTTYAGHFLIEAQNQGYEVQPQMLSRWKTYQQRQSANWSPGSGASDLNQAYRLFVLSLARAPEMGAMNRLKETGNLSVEAKWVLAATYAKAGHPEVAREMIQKLPTQLPDQGYDEWTYGSGLRNEAFILQTLDLCGKDREALQVMTRICTQLGSESWYSTQTTAMSLLAVARFVGNSAVSKSNLGFSWKAGNADWKKVVPKGKVVVLPLPTDSKTRYEVRLDDGPNRIFVRLVHKGQPIQEDPVTYENNLAMKVRYTDMQGKTIDPAVLEQGTDFRAEVEVAHAGNQGENFTQLALRQAFPSGWEIRNTRIEGAGLPAYAAVPEYQDIRDDRVHSFFSLKPRQTKTFVLLLQAAYPGNYVLPSVVAESMYNANIGARRPGGRVRVIPRKPGS